MGNTTPLPPRKENSTEDEDEELLATEPWVEAPFRADFGTNVRLGEGVFINFNCTIIDTCLVSIGARTLLAPNVSLYSGTHPLDPELRNGTNGPESGKPITIEEDVWIGGNVTVCPGVTIGRGSTVGAGSVVTKVSSTHLMFILRIGEWCSYMKSGCCSLHGCGRQPGKGHQAGVEKHYYCRGKSRDSEDCRCCLSLSRSSAHPGVLKSYFFEVLCIFASTNPPTSDRSSNLSYCIRISLCFRCGD